MPKEPELKARDKVVLRMKREGAVEENLTAGTEQRVSKRLEDAELVKPAETAEPSEALSAEEQKKVQMRRQQRQFQAEHAENNDTQPPSETSVTEEKRAENPPQIVPEPLPSETPFKPPTLEQHGVSSHTGTVIAETVVTHKLRKTSAVEAVDADAILTQAAETASAKPVSDDAAPPTKRMQKLERKSEKAHERLDAAREKLPTHKVLKKERVFDEETGKGKTRLHFEDELKKPKGKGKLQFEADKTVRKVGDTLASGIHGKIHEVEQENSAVEAAHKTEIAAETAARHFRHHRESSVNKPYEKVSKLEHKADAADAKLQYERNQQEHPEMKKQNLNKHYQKQNIKKEYAAARNAGSQTAGTATKNTGKKLGEKVSDKIKEFFEKNKKVFIWIGVGIVAALYKNRWMDWWVMLVSMAGICIPAFVVAPLLGVALGMHVPGLSVAGWDSPGCVVLPALTLGLVNAAYLARLTRGGMIEVLGQDFIRTARAKGAGPFRTVWKHALRGGLIPALSYLGPAFAAMITGSFVVETCFQVPGMGQHFVNATTDRDYFLIQGLVLFYGILIVAANLGVDLVQMAVNPRLRKES